MAVVKAIYAPYARADVTTPLLGNCFFVPPTGRPCAGPARDYVSPRLAERLERYANQGTGADPVACAQNSPRTVTFGRPQARGSAATIVVHERFSADADHPVTVTVNLGA